MYESIEQIGDNQKAAYAKTMQRLQDENVHPAQVNQPAEKAPAGDDAPMTRTEIMALIQVLTDFVKGVATGIDGKFATIESVNGVANKILQDINRRGYQNQQQVQDIAKDAVPPSIQGFDSDSTRKTGDTLKLLSGATSGTGDKIVAVPGAVGGFDWTKCFFGFKVDPDGDGSGTKVRIYAGEVDRTAVAQTDVTVSDGDFIYIAWTEDAPPE